MKRLFQILTASVFMLSASSTSVLADDSYDFDMHPDSSGVIDIYENPKGNRMPARHVNCVISKESGISLSTIDSSEITSFEITDLSGNIVAFFVDSEDFISFFFSLKGDYMIRFSTSRIVLTGYVSL